jgi:hypothetical protein
MHFDDVNEGVFSNAASTIKRIGNRITGNRPKPVITKEKKNVKYEDIPPNIRARLKEQGVNEAADYYFATLMEDLGYPVTELSSEVLRRAAAKRREQANSRYDKWMNAQDRYRDMRERTVGNDDIAQNVRLSRARDKVSTASQEYHKYDRKATALKDYADSKDKAFGIPHKAKRLGGIISRKFGK